MLPAPTFDDGGGDYVAPRDPVETAVAKVFAETLGIARISIHADFFEMGGHSLSAAKAVARIRSKVDAAIPLKRLFECPTVAELCNSIHLANRSQQGTPLKRKTSGHSIGNQYNASSLASTSLLSASYKDSALSAWKLSKSQAKSQSGVIMGASMPNKLATTPIFQPGSMLRRIRMGNTPERVHRQNYLQARLRAMTIRTRSLG